MLSENYQFGGMHLIWWIIWFMFFLWAYLTPYTIPGLRRKSNSPLAILKRRFAAGYMSNEKYLQKKKLLRSGI